MKSFEIGEIPEDGYRRSGGNPLYGELKTALDSLPEGKAIFIPCPEGKDLARFRTGIEQLFRMGRFRDCGYKISTSKRPDRNMIAIWKKTE